MKWSHGIRLLKIRGVYLGRGGPTTYVVHFPRVLKTVDFPVQGCPEVAHSARRLRDYFVYQNFWSKVEVLQEGKEPLPRCDMFGIHMPVGG